MIPFVKFDDLPLDVKKQITVGKRDTLHIEPVVLHLPDGQERGCLHFQLGDQHTILRSDESVMFASKVAGAMRELQEYFSPTKEPRQ